MRLVLAVRPPFAVSSATDELTVLTSPTARVEIGPLVTPAQPPQTCVSRLLAELEGFVGPPRILVDEQRRSRHGWPVRLVQAQKVLAPGAKPPPTAANHVVLVYYQCLGHSAEVMARLVDTQPQLPPGLLSLLMSGSPDFRRETETIVALSEIWEP